MQKIRNFAAATLFTNATTLFKNYNILENYLLIWLCTAGIQEIWKKEVSLQVLSSDNLCKQFGSKLFELLIFVVVKNVNFEKKSGSKLIAYH